MAASSVLVVKRWREMGEFIEGGGMTVINVDKWLRVRHYARERFQEEVDDLLDDPSELWHEHAGPPPLAEALAKMRRLAGDLDMDFDKMVAAGGTEFERERLRKMLGM